VLRPWVLSVDLSVDIMVGEVRAPGAAASDEWLHHGALCLNGVYQVVGRPFVEHLLQGHGSQFAVACGAAEIRFGHLGQGLQATRPHPGKGCGDFIWPWVRIHRYPLGVWVKGLEIPPRQECLDARRKDPLLGIQQVQQAFQQNLAQLQGGAGNPGGNPQATGGDIPVNGIEQLREESRDQAISDQPELSYQ